MKYGILIIYLIGLFGSGLAVADSFSDLQTQVILLRQRIAAKQSQMDAFQVQAGFDTKSASEIDSKIEWYKKVFAKPKAEQEFLKNASAEQASVQSVSNEISKLNLQVLRAVRRYLESTNEDYEAKIKVMNFVAPILGASKHLLQSLDSASADITLAMVSSGVNAGVSAYNAVKASNKDKDNSVAGAILSAGAQLIVEKQVDSALQAAAASTKEAEQFADRLESVVSQPFLQESGLLSGGWNGLLGRGVIYGLVTGNNPLRSHAFNLVTSISQVSDLIDAKKQVGLARKEIQPLETQMQTEFDQLTRDTQSIEKAILADLK